MVNIPKNKDFSSDQCHEMNEGLDVIVARCDKNLDRAELGINTDWQTIFRDLGIKGEAVHYSDALARLHTNKDCQLLILDFPTAKEKRPFNLFADFYRVAQEAKERFSSSVMILSSDSDAFEENMRKIIRFTDYFLLKPFPPNAQQSFEETVESMLYSGCGCHIELLAVNKYAAELDSVLLSLYRNDVNAKQKSLTPGKRYPFKMFELKKQEITLLTTVEVKYELDPRNDSKLGSVSYFVAQLLFNNKLHNGIFPKLVSEL